jgi:hypothetical protein
MIQLLFSKSHPNFKNWDAEAPVNNPDSSFHYWRKLLALRKEKDVLFTVASGEQRRDRLREVGRDWR